MSQKKPTLKDRALSAVIPSFEDASSSKLQGTVPRTGPGAMMAHLARESSAQKENERLRDELAQWEGATPARRLDPSMVVPGRYANRLEDSFSGPEFVALKEEIRVAGGNVQPIKVRPLPDGRFEIVFGHRRHRACLELGLPVLAIIESIDERTLFVEMDRENRLREDLRPFEQGEMYRKALDSGLFPSLRSLAEAVGVDPGNASKAVALAKLPDVVLDAFPTRLDLQYRWASPLSKFYEAQPAIMSARASRMADEKRAGQRRSAAEVFEALIAPAESKSVSASHAREIVGESGRKAVWRVRNGRQLIEIDLPELNPKAAKQLEAAIKAVLA